MEDTEKKTWPIQLYKRIFDWFALPEQKSHPVLAFKLHSLLFVFSVAQFFMGSFAVAGFINISHPSKFLYPTLALLLGWVAILCLKYTKRLQLCSNILIFSIIINVTYFSFITDGFRHATYAWLVFIPILSALLTNRSTTIIWTAAAIIINFVGNWLSVKYNIVNHFNPNQLMFWRVAQQTALFISISLGSYFLIMQQKASSNYLRKKIISQKNLMRILVHDISNPLSTIHLSAQLLSAGGDELSASIAGIRIQKNADRIMSIIQLIRDMDGWEGGKKKLQLLPINISNVIDEVISMHQNRLTSKNIKLNRSYSTDEHVWGHPTMLAEQIIGNLLANAIKFSFEGATIDISIEPTSRYEITVVIRDYGIGIPYHIQKVLFDPLAHTTRTGTAGEKGTGFGLPITKTCVDLIGGRLKIMGRNKDEYPQDHGTRAVLILKRADGVSVS